MDSRPAEGPTWRRPGAWLLLAVVAALATAADLASKRIAFDTIAGAPVAVSRTAVQNIERIDPRGINALIPRHEPVTAIPRLLEFQLVLNPGAVFGIGPGNRLFFIAFTAVAIAFALAMFAYWTRPCDRWAHAAIGLVLGGGLGNLYDRLSVGCVRDFIHPLPGWRWPSPLGRIGIRGEVWPYVSNVADLLLLIGIVILLAYLWRRDRSDRSAADARADAAE